MTSILQRLSQILALPVMTSLATSKALIPMIRNGLVCFQSARSVSGERKTSSLMFKHILVIASTSVLTARSVSSANMISSVTQRSIAVLSLILAVAEIALPAMTL